MRRLATFSLLLGLAACAVPEETPPETAAAPATRRTPQELAARLPERLEQFQRGNPAQLPGGQGVEYPYATPGRRIAGHVQLRAATGPVGTEALDSELRAMAAEAAAGPQHRRLRERGRESVAGLNCITLEGNFGRMPVDSLACAGAFGGQVLRLRLTMARREGRMDEAKRFAEGIAAALR